MRIKFWGTRGSYPAPISSEDIRKKIIRALSLANGINFSDNISIEKFVDEKLPFSVTKFYGTNTSCVQIYESESDIIICDAGSGIRALGQEIVNKYKPGAIPAIHIFLSHLHWDHISGFPFFLPAYIPGTKINIYGFHPFIKEYLVKQQDPAFFPVPFDGLSADISFHTLEINSAFETAGIVIKGILQNHPGASYGYSFEKDGKKIVYSTDAEHNENMNNDDSPFVEFIRNADALIFDAQFVFLDEITDKKDWGHSSSVTGVELALRAGVKNLFLFHTEPTDDDKTLDEILQKTILYSSHHLTSDNLNILIAYDGLVFEV
jgi:phosphoribosyl 1,2-cyclic phosphodiesterase